VTDVEIRFYCEGHCDVDSHITGLLHDTSAFEVGEVVYAEKKMPDGTHITFHGHQFNGCKGGARAVIAKTIVRCPPSVTDESSSSCFRYCLESADDKNVSLGCWTRENLYHEKDCSNTKRIGRWIVEQVRGSDTGKPVDSERTLLYRKVNVRLNDVKVRARAYLHKTRSLMEVANEEPTEEKRSRAYESMVGAFGKVKGALRAARHPVEFIRSNLDLIKQYKLNVKEVTNDEGEVVGVEIVSCNLMTDNPETHLKDLPPLPKCYRLDIADLQIFTSRSDYLVVEETASREDRRAQQGILGRMAHDAGRIASEGLGLRNVGFVLAVVTKTARMAFARDVVMIKAMDPRGQEEVLCR